MQTWVWLASHDKQRVRTVGGWGFCADSQKLSPMWPSKSFHCHWPHTESGEEKTLKPAVWNTRELDSASDLYCNSKQLKLLHMIVPPKYKAIHCISVI